MKVIGNRLVLATVVILVSHVAMADDSCVDLNGCYENSKESQGALQSLIKAESWCGGLQLTKGKVFTTGDRKLSLPDRTAQDLRISDPKDKIIVDADSVTRTETVYSPPTPEFQMVTKTRVVEAGGDACGTVATVRTLVEEISYPGHFGTDKCQAFPSVAPQACEALVAYRSNRTVALCDF